MAAWRAWGRYLLGALASALIGWVAFGMGKPVPGLDAFDLAVHETGHLLTGLMPRMVMFMAGSAAQVMAPLGLAAYFFFRRGEWASAGFCLAWAGTSARDVAVYVADAPVQALPLIGGGTHDWAYLLGPQGFNCIDQAGNIARFIEVIGGGLVIGGIALCLWPLWRHYRERGLSPVPEHRSTLVPDVDPAGDPWLATAAPAVSEQRSPTEGVSGSG
jgi:hypothetical protein